MSTAATLHGIKSRIAVLEKRIDARLGKPPEFRDRWNAAVQRAKARTQTKQTVSTTQKTDLTESRTDCAFSERWNAAVNRARQRVRA